MNVLNLNVDYDMYLSILHFFYDEWGRSCHPGRGNFGRHFLDDLLLIPRTH